MNNKTQTKTQTNETRLLLATLAEMKARGMEIPSNFKIHTSSKKSGWNTDENGYFIKIDGTHFRPRDELVDFLKSKARFILLRSGRGGGKTVAGAQKAIAKIKSGQSGAVMNPDFENFRTSTWIELRNWIPWEMVVPKQRYRKSESWEPIRPFTMVFVNGARMYCKGLKDPESARGANLNWFWYDEGRRDPTGMGWRNAIAFVRVGKEPQAWCTTTPAGSQHWTTTFFNGEISDEVKKILDDLGLSKTQKLFEVFQTGIERNKENLDPMFYASIISAYPSGYLRRREVDGLAADEEGSIGDRTWFDGKILDERPDWIKYQVRFWDLAATEKKMTPGKKKNDPDETIGTLLGTDESKSKFVVQEQTGGFWKWETIKKMVVEVAKLDGQEVKVCFEQEPGSGGKNQVAELIDYMKKELPEWDISGLEAKKLGDRVLAANTWFGEAADGNWFLVKGIWVRKFLDQLDVFPNPAVHDDTITSVTGARHKIAPVRKWKKIQFVAVGMNENQA